MSRDEARPVTIAVDAERRVSGLFQCPPHATACYVVAHGAGAGMTHPFMAAIAEALAERKVATLRYQFPYMERGSKRPDPPELAQATVRAAVMEASRLAPGLPLVAGGKSFGGRMTSQAQAASTLPGVRGLVFLGFPLHPPGQPSDQRAKHLFEVRCPMFFCRERAMNSPTSRCCGRWSNCSVRLQPSGCSKTPTIPVMCRRERGVRIPKS